MKLREIRDPIHVFVRVDPDEGAIVDSLPLQRLRHIHQLAMSYLVYPGATHRRFEHSLGVMELAGRVFDVVTSSDVSPLAKELLPELQRPEDFPWWRRVVRLAALCHDVGHLPFSHASEAILPDGIHHEDFSRRIILHAQIAELLSAMRPPIPPELVAKIAVGRKHAPDESWSAWETILSEIIVDDAFGVDRMDYLLRDSHHAGVAYGHFDHYRLIDTLRILVPTIPGTHEPGEPDLGVEIGGLHSATALLLARYFMFSQVYFHRVRVAYDLHLVDFMEAFLEGGKVNEDLDEFLALTDNEVLAGMRSAIREGGQLAVLARRILERKHFKTLYQSHPADQHINPAAAAAIRDGAIDKFGQEAISYWEKQDAAGEVLFPVLMRDGSVVQSVDAAEQLRAVPAVRQEYVFIEPSLRAEGLVWLAANRDRLIEEGVRA